MPVIINDLEVVIETPAPSAQQGEASNTESGTSSPVELMPYDISMLQRQQRERIERVRAH
jgi:hypothetical protein